MLTITQRQAQQDAQSSLTSRAVIASATSAMLLLSGCDTPPQRPSVPSRIPAPRVFEEPPPVPRGPFLIKKEPIGKGPEGDAICRYTFSDGFSGSKLCELKPPQFVGTSTNIIPSKRVFIPGKMNPPGYQYSYNSITRKFEYKPTPGSLEFGKWINTPSRVENCIHWLNFDERTGARGFPSKNCN